MKLLSVFAVLFSTAVASFAQGGLSSVVFTNLDRHYFDIDFTRFNTNIVRVNLNTNQFDVSGDTITIIGSFSNVVINPTDGYVPVRASPTNFVNSPIKVTATNEIEADIFNTYYMRVTNLVTGGIVVSIPDGPAGVLTNLFGGPGFLFSDGGSPNAYSFLDINEVCLWTNSGGYLSPVDLTKPLYWTNSVTWGTTNVMRRVQGYWELTNDSPGLKLTATGNYQAILTNRSDVATLTAAGASLGVGLVDAAGNEARWVGNALIPLQASANFGQPIGSELWGNSYFNGTIYDYGFLSGANYSRGTISHTGTNGYWLFDSQGSGTAGAGRPIFFGAGGTNLYIFNNVPTDPFISVTNSSGSVKLNSFGGNAYVQGGTVLYAVNKNSAGLIIGASDNTVAPTSDNAINLGGPATSTTFKDIGLKGYLYLQTSHTPASAADTGLPGAIAWDTGFVYVCTATNTWKRAAIATW